MPATSTLRRATLRLRRLPRLRRGFTLMEMAAAAAVMSILVAASAVSFTAVQNHRRDEAGKTMLATAQLEGRRVAATNGYAFPSDLPTRLTKRNPAGGEFKFVTGSSYAPGSSRNRSAAYQVSVATDGNNVTAYAVQTRTGDSDTGHCRILVDDLSRTGGDTARWGYSQKVATSECTAAKALTCPGFATGTVDQPSDLGDLRTCPS